MGWGLGETLGRGHILGKSLAMAEQGLEAHLLLPGLEEECIWGEEEEQGWVKAHRGARGISECSPTPSSGQSHLLPAESRIILRLRPPLGGWCPQPRVPDKVLKLCLQAASQ